MEQAESESSDGEVVSYNRPSSEQTRETRRIITLPSCLNWPISFLTIFLLGVMLAFPGGGLLARMMKVGVESLELLLENDLLMKHLHRFIQDSKHFDRYVTETLSIPQSSINDLTFNTFVSVLAEEFAIFSSCLSLLVGGAIGLAMFEMVINKYGSRSGGEALARAGPVSLVAVTTVGSLLGVALQGFLSISYTLIISFYVTCCVVGFIVCYFEENMQSSPCMRERGRGRSKFFAVVMFLMLTPLNTPVMVCCMFLFSFMLKSKLLLSVASIPKLIFLVKAVQRYGFTLVTLPVTLMLMITDVFNFAHQPIVTVQAPTNVSSAVLEGLFVGVLTPQLLMTSVGMSMFLSWARSGIFPVGATAISLGCGMVVLLESLVPFLGAGPTIGALMGVAVAAGVSLSAAMAAADYYGQDIGLAGLVGRLGVMVGAGLGGFLTSTNHKLSAVFTGLLAASVPAGVYLSWLTTFLLADGRRGYVKAFLYVPLAALGVLWVYFSLPIQGLMTFIAFVLLSAAPGLLLAGVMICCDCLGLFPMDS